MRSSRLRRDYLKPAGTKCRQVRLSDSVLGEGVGASHAIEDDVDDVRVIRLGGTQLRWRGEACVQLRPVAIVRGQIPRPIARCQESEAYADNRDEECGKKVRVVLPGAERTMITNTPARNVSPNQESAAENGITPTNAAHGG